MPNTVTTQIINKETVQIVVTYQSGFIVDNNSEGSGGFTPTNLTVGNVAPNSIEIQSSTGTSVILSGATTSIAGLLTGADKQKLNGIQAGATANATNAQLRDRSTHTGLQLASSILLTNTKKLLGRFSPNSGASEEISVGTGLTLINGVLQADLQQWIVVVDDTFDRANSSSVGNGWTNIASNGTLSILNNALRLQRASSVEPVAARPTTENALNQEAIAYWTASGHGALVHVRLQSASAYYAVGIAGGASTNVVLYRNVAGLVPIHTATIPAIVNGTNYSLRLRATGANPTFLEYELRNETTGVSITNTIVTSDSSASLQLAGRTAISGVADPDVRIDRFITRALTFTASGFLPDTDSLPEGTLNRYFSDARARLAINVTGGGSYNPTTGIIEINPAPVISAFGRTGEILPQTGDYNTAQIPEGNSVNRYWTPTREQALINEIVIRARNAISVANNGNASYDSTTGIITVNNGGGGTTPPPTVNWQTQFEDTFNRANSTTVGNSWSNVASNGSLAIEGNQLRINQISGVAAIAARPTSESRVDHEIEAVWNASASHGLRSMLRLQSANTYYTAFLTAGATSSVSIARMIAGTLTTIQNFTINPAILVDAAYALRFRVNGTNPTTLSFELKNNLTQAVVASGSTTDNTSILQAPGRAAISSAVGDATAFIDGIVARSPSPNIVYNVILAIGQSNTVGQGEGITSDDRQITNGIDQYSLSGSTTNTIIPAADPLSHPAINTDRVGFVYNFAKLFHATIPSGERTLIIPAADNGTSFTQNEWNPGNSKYNAAVNAANTVLSQYPGSKLSAIVWLQGESDFLLGMSANTYRTRLDAMINAMRSAITGAANTPFIAGEFVPEWNDAVNASSIQAITDQLPSRLARTAIASSRFPTVLVSNAGDAVHYNGASLRELGRRYFNRLQSAIQNNPSNLPPIPTGLTLISATQTFLTLRWDYPLGNVVTWELSYRIGNGTPTIVSIPFNARIHATGYVLTGLTGATNYTIQVRALNSQGTSSYSVELSASTIGASWQTQFEDTFNRANSTTVGNSWSNVASNGSLAIEGNQLRINRVSNIEAIAARPTSENALNQEVEITWNVVSGHGLQAIVRLQSAQNYYTGFVTSGAVNIVHIAKVVSGALTIIQSFTISPALILGGSYVLKIRATNANPTTLSVEVINAASQAIIGSGTTTDNTTVLQVEGRAAVTSTADPTAYIDRFIHRKFS